ncbi:SMP-30/gluconolactonase/LRE family protein [Sphingobacterium pedocola]|uniref:Gluconolactonase n=1 Tax=Sphingobacterium pedocola TaxID=2082722 RepID=A0ABR9TBN7_9SPHI|nr:SMP-30/gluconolactonase/LRE family protein [Sphingobacterium pedocola]MBE8722775.1 gluconolactonase [Sphingobacterium pedocola]
MKLIVTSVLITCILCAKGQSQGGLILISDQFSFAEGPAVDSKGNIYFTDQPNNKIWKYTSEGKLDVFLESAGRSNGLYIDKDDHIIACADEKNELWRIAPSGNVEVLLDQYNGRKFNGPNDVWISPAGGCYFTDPHYQREYWTRKGKEIEEEALYLFQGGILTQVDPDFIKPNGIVGTADGRLLYVADIRADKTYVYDIDEKGNLVNKKLFCNQGSDGMTIDQKGNVYLTGKGVTIYNVQGQKIHHIDVPANWTANVCFGGKEKEYLFITASEKIFKIYPDWL